MRITLLLITFLVSASGAHAQNSSYTQGYRDGFRDGVAQCSNPGPQPQGHVRCEKTQKGFSLIRNADNGLLGEAGKYFPDQVSCQRAALTASDKYACAPYDFFGVKILVHDIWTNKVIGGVRTVARECFDQLERLKQGQPLMCIEAEGYSGSYTVYHVKKDRTYFPRIPFSRDECLKIVDNTSRTQFCFREYLNSPYYQFDFDGIKEPGKQFPNLDGCLLDLRSRK